MNNIKTIKCAICGAEMMIEESNNAYPIREYSYIGEEENRCCHSCDDMFVIPARISFYSAKLSEEKEKEYHEILKEKTYNELIEIFTKK